MKQAITLSVLIAGMLTLLAGCSKMNLDDIFSDNNKDAILPLEDFPEFFSDINEFLQDRYITGQIISKNKKGTASADYAVIINSCEQLEGIETIDGKVIDFHGIDFDKYSIVVASCNFPDASYFVNRQRIVKRSDKINLYLEVNQRRDVIVLAVPACHTFSAIYPNMPSSEVNVIRWENH